MSEGMTVFGIIGIVTLLVFTILWLRHRVSNFTVEEIGYYARHDFSMYGQCGPQYRGERSWRFRAKDRDLSMNLSELQQGAGHTLYYLKLTAPHRREMTLVFGNHYFKGVGIKDEGAYTRESWTGNPLFPEMLLSRLLAVANNLVQTKEAA